MAGHMCDEGLVEFFDENPLKVIPFSVNILDPLCTFLILVLGKRLNASMPSRVLEPRSESIL
ncbi:MAG: hypothetical protein ABSB22_24915 [Thermodesulfobacteriota bacterium]|jgi:hypothetical protein